MELLDVTSVLSRIPALPGASEGVAMISASDNGGRSLLQGVGNRIVDIVLDDPAVGMLLPPVSTPLPDMGPPILEMALHAHPVYRAMVGGGVPVVRNMRNGVSAARALLNHPRRRFPDAVVDTPHFVQVPADAPRTVLSEEKSLAWLAVQELDPVRHEVLDANDEAALVAAADTVGYPLVVKAVAGAEELCAVRSTMLANLNDLTVRSRIVAEIVSGGVELVVGITQDPVFGDTAISVLPFDEARAREMVDSLRLRPLLGDANPLLVRPDGVVMVDAVVSVVDGSAHGRN